MKITLFLTTVCMLLCCSGTNPSKRSKEDIAPQRIPLADPYILLHEGIYYAYGTFAENGIAALRVIVCHSLYLTCKFSCLFRIRKIPLFFISHMLTVLC